MRRFLCGFTIFFGLGAALLLSGCSVGAVATPAPVTLSIAGSTEMHPVLHELTVAYGQRHPNVLFTLRGGGSTLGERWVAEGRIHLAASTLEPDDPPQADGLVRVPIALDGLAVIVHRSNPVEGLTLLQLRSLYSGRILDWQEVGGAPGEVLLISREDGSGARRLFEERIMGEESVALTAVVMPTSQDVVAYVEDHPLAVGYVSRAYVLRALDAAPASGEGMSGEDAPPVKVLSVEGVLPDRESIAVQRYPLTWALYLVRRTRGDGLPQSFIDFVLSPPGQEIVARYHAPVR